MHPAANTLEMIQRFRSVSLDPTSVFSYKRRSRLGQITRACCSPTQTAGVCVAPEPLAPPSGSGK